MSVEQNTTDEAATTTEGVDGQQASEQTATVADEQGHEQQPENQASDAGTEPEQGAQGDGDGGQPDESTQDKGAPEQYEQFQAPEGQQLDAQTVEQFAEVAKELDLSQGAAQKMLDKMAPVLAQRQADQIADVQKQWAEQAKVDKEFGGENLQQSLGQAEGALKNYATPEFRQLLKETGLGNHPEMIRFCVRVGKATGEDGFVSGQAAPGGGKRKPFYPNSNMN